MIADRQAYHLNGVICLSVFMIKKVLSTKFELYADF